MKAAPYALLSHKSQVVALREDRDNTTTIERFNTPTRMQSAALQKRNQELAAYAHTIAHDLKDPLSVILATSDAIFHITDLTPEELRAYLQQIQSTAYMMNDMIDNLLLLSELGDATVPVAPLDMGTIVSHILMRLGYIIKQHHAQIDLPENWPVATGYAPWIEEVWANFISNAIKYGGRPPHVELGAASRLDGMVMFWIRDNGLGVSPEVQAHLFQPFNQYGPVRTAGHGLGLSIVRRIVEKLGGQVGLQTEAGRSSQFFFTLPARR